MWKIVFIRCCCFFTHRPRYATSNNIQADESGELRQGGAEGAYLVKRGSYSFVGPDGVTYTINYSADENGYVPWNEYQWTLL